MVKLINLLPILTSLAFTSVRIPTIPSFLSGSVDCDSPPSIPPSILINCTTQASLDSAFSPLTENYNLALSVSPKKGTSSSSSSSSRMSLRRFLFNNFAKASRSRLSTTRKIMRRIRVVGDSRLYNIDSDSDSPKAQPHAVVQLLHHRLETSSTPQSRSQSKSKSKSEVDTAKVALCIEGGGMRGCVSAGMASCIHHLNLTSSFDVVYGSSAGSLIGAYFITGQLPYFGPEVYYDLLTKKISGKGFIDTGRIGRALGLGLVDPRLVKDTLFRREMGKPVLDLSYLLKSVAIERQPLDWDKFERAQKEEGGGLPLKVSI